MGKGEGIVEGRAELGVAVLRTIQDQKRPGGGGRGLTIWPGGGREASVQLVLGMRHY